MAAVGSVSTNVCGKLRRAQEKAIACFIQVKDDRVLVLQKNDRVRVRRAPQAGWIIIDKENSFMISQNDFQNLKRYEIQDDVQNLNS